MAEYYPNTKRKPRLSASTAIEGGKLPPQATDLEEAVLGALMLEKTAITEVAEILKVASFYKEAHQMIFQSMVDLFSRAEPIDILTVSSDLRKKAVLDVVGGAYYITQLTNKVSSAANIKYHAQIIAEKFLQRELIRISTEIQTEAFEDDKDAFELLDSSERKLFEVSQGNIKKDVRGINAVVKEALVEINSLKDKEGGMTGISSGFARLDKVTAGFQKSDLIIIAARPGMGKTALALSLARNASLISEEKPRSVAIFSLEMSSKQLVTRMLSSESEIEGDKLKRGTLADHEWQQLNTRIAKLNDAPIFIDDTPALTVFELRAKCRRLKQQHNIEIIIIDYLQLMTAGGDGKGNREQEISMISRSLKSIAKELDVPILALSQLNRSVETRGSSKKPQLSDLRESGAIEQDADMVTFIYRPEYYGLEVDEDNVSTKGIAKIIIAKHRNGALDEIPLRFINTLAKFDNLNSEEITESFSNQMRPNEGFDNGFQPGITIASRINRMDEEEPF